MKKIYCSLFLLLFFSFQTSHAQLTADFEANITQGCTPLDSVQFSDLSTGGATTWLWNFDNGNTSILQNPQASFPNPGVYTISLTVGNGTAQDTETKTNYIRVFNIPVAHFNYTPASPCVNSPVVFTDNSALGDAPLVSWNWSFGDGNSIIETTGTVNHAYTIPLVYPVSVIAIDSNGCESDYNTNITVLPDPQAEFQASPLVGCSTPFTVSFTNTSVTSGTVSYLWYFGDGATSPSQSPQHTYTTAGLYDVSLVVIQGGCRDSVNKIQYVKIIDYQPNFVASDSTICVGDSVYFTETSNPLSVNRVWYFGDGALSVLPAPGHVYTNPGTYTVKLVATDPNGCIDSLIKTNYITVSPLPVANFTANDTVTCLYPFTVNFTSLSTGAVSWVWDFGDGNNSALQNPVHTFQLPGFYNVSLIVTNANGCIDTLIKLSYIIIVPPIANFTITPKKGCAPLNVNFTSTSVSNDLITNYAWNYGDGSGIVNTVASFTNHTYPNPGVYPVSLAITTQQGCRDTIVDTVRVGFHVNPSFTISDDTVCYSVPIQFTLTTPGANSWTWYFGDGSVDSLNQDPIHIYGNPGTFTVSLVACNNGCCDTLVIPDMITILPPKAQFQLIGSCAAPFTITCTDLSVQADSIVWDFHDGTFVSNVSPVNHTFATRGVKTITLHAYNFTTGCQDSISQGYTVTVPVAQFTGSPLSGCFPLTVSFQDTSQDAYNHTWYFGDGVTFTTFGTALTHPYNFPGYYTVTEVITDIHGCTDSISKINYVHVFGPLIGFTSDIVTGCKPLHVIFTDTTVSEFPITSQVWNFGDGTIVNSAADTISHIYSFEGFYTVTLTLTDSMGCTAVLTKPNYILVSQPYPKLVVDTFSCPGNTILLNASASQGFSPVFYWQFGDGDTLTSTASSTTHIYATGGNYTISLTVTDLNGCDSTITRNILIDSPIANFVTDSIVYGCGNTQGYFTNTSTGANITSILWNFGNGAISTNLGYGQYTQPGTFNVSLVVTNSAGCSDTITKDSLVVVNNPVGNFEFTPKEGCNPLTVTFIAHSPNSLVYSWDYGDGNQEFSTDSIITHTYSSDLIAQPILILSSDLPDGHHCEVQANVIGDSLVIVQTFVDVGIAIDGDSSITVVEVSEGDLLPLSVFTDIGAGNAVYSWTPSAGLSCSDCSDPFLSGTGQSIYYYVEVTDAGGCVGIDSILVKFVDCETGINFPNIFTPNGDDVNDFFQVQHPCLGTFKLTIYNRWGQKIFETTSPVVKWDGRTNSGDYVPDGTYYWIFNSEKKTAKGFVQLIKEKKN